MQEPGAMAVDASSGLELPWGPGSTLRLGLPATLAVDASDVVWPDLRGALDDYRGALDRALDAPVESARLEDTVGPGSTIAIVVDDPSRWTPVREALPIVLGRLHAAGVRKENVTISVGVGRHHAVDLPSMKTRVGEEIAAAYRCFSPPVDDLSAYADLGTTEQGIPVRVFRPVAEADLRIMIGSVLPHLQAGFGGGYKLIFPGTSHRTTLGALHRQGLTSNSDAARLLGGDAASNPMRLAIGQAAGMLGPMLLDQPSDRRASSSLAGERGQARARSGDPVPRGPAAVSRPVFRARRRRRGGQPPVAGRPHAKLQGLAAPSRSRQAGRRSGGPLLDRSRRDRPVVPSRGLAPDLGHGRTRRLGHPPPGSTCRTRHVGRGLSQRLHASLGARTGG